MPRVHGLYTNRVGLSTPTPLYLWVTVGVGGFEFGAIVRTQACKAAFGVCVGSNPTADHLDSTLWFETG